MALFSKFSTHRKVERLIREGVGVREASWRIGFEDAAQAAVIDDVLEWVRQSMGAMRRPYGLDHVALALAARDDSGRVVCSNSLGVQRPTLFYEAEGADHIRAFLGDANRAMGGQPGEMVGALLSLGDIAFELNGRAA